MKVFDDRIRDDARPNRETEGFFAFLNRVSGEYWDQVRTVIEEWIADFPEDGRKDLAARISDRNDDVNVFAALWELYLHRMFVGAGCNVEHHPMMGDSNRRPDFRINSPRHVFYVEATRLSTPHTKIASDNRKKVLYEALNEVDSPNFFLQVEIESEGIEAPSVRRLKTAVSNWIARLDPDDVPTVGYGRRLEDLACLEWEHRGWRITLGAIPKRAGRRGLPGRRTVGIYPGSVIAVDDVKSIRSALRDKGGAYGSMAGRPYLIAIATSSIFHDDDNLDEALFGKTVDRSRLGKPPTRSPSGYWRGQNGPQHSRVSGILTVHDPHPWRWTTAVPSIWENPNLGSAVPALSTWRRVSMDGVSYRVEQPREEPHMLLGLPSEWPHGEPFPERTR